MTESCHECRDKVHTFYLRKKNESCRQQFKVAENSFKKGKNMKVEI